MKKLFIFLMWLVLSLNGQLVSQSLPDSLQLATLETFREQYGKNWIIRWDKETGVPTSIFRGKTISIAKDPVKAARLFLKQNYDLFKIDISESKLDLVRVQKRHNITFVKFKQIHRSIPVYGAEFILAVTSEGEIISATGKYYPNEFTLSTFPEITELMALNSAKSEFKQSVDLYLHKSELIILPHDKNFKLAWKFVVFDQKSFESWFYFVDAKSGRILKKQDATIRATTGKGNIYFEYPNGPYSLYYNVDLPRLDDSGNLKGEYANVRNPTTRAYRSDHNFTNIPTTSNLFDEVNVYCHIDTIRTEFFNPLGFNGFSQIEAIVNYYLNDACYNPDFDRLEFGNVVPKFSREAKIIYHEYTHSIVYSICGLRATSEESGAVNEGLADYFACSYVGTPVIGEYVNVKLRGYRDMSSPYAHSYSDYINYYGNYEIYVGGEFFSHILWTLRSQLGPSTNNTIVFNSIDNINTQVNFESFRDAMMNESGSQSNQNTIQNTFADHGVGDHANSPPAPPQNLAISINLSYNPILNWVAPNEPDLSHYEVYRKKISDPNFVKIAITSATSYTDYTVTRSGYFNQDDIDYRVCSVDEEGLVSGPSNEVNLLSTYGLGFNMNSQTTIAQNQVQLIPQKYALYQNHPNPFNPNTMITFDIPATSQVKIEIYNLRGQLVEKLVDGLKKPGQYKVQFDASHLPSGIYLARLVAGNYVKIKQMILLK